MTRFKSPWSLGILAVALGLSAAWLAWGGGASAQRPTAAPTVLHTSVVFQLAWGAGDQALGHRIPQEAAPEGPMSFAVGTDGRVFVLDQVNQRVQVVERGRVTHRVGLPTDTFQDIALGAGNRLVVLDRLAQRRVAVRSGPGSWRYAPVEGPGIPSGGGVTGLFTRRDGVWLEWAHTHVVRVAGRAGGADAQRPQRWGRMAGDGTGLVRAVRASASEVVILGRDRRSAKPTTSVLARVSFPLPVAQILALEVEAPGRIYLVAHLLDGVDTPPYRVRREELRVVLLNAAGRELARTSLPANHGPEDQFRGFRVGPDGALYHLHFGARVATLRRVAP